MKTKVIFRKWKDGGIIALFPEEAATVGNPYHCNSYEHVGQHGGADPRGVIRATTPATPKEYADLKRELENYGPPEAHYDLKVITRYRHGSLSIRREQLK